MTVSLPKANLFVCGGQSNMFSPEFNYNGPTAIPWLIRAAFPDAVTRFGVKSGSYWSEREVVAPQHVDRWLGSVSGYKFFLDMGGNNEINDAGLPTGASVLAVAESYWANRRAAGFDYILSTTIIDGVGMTGPGEQAKRAAANALFRTSSELDACIDLEIVEVNGVAVFEDSGFTTSSPGGELSAYKDDEIHINELGAELVAAEFVTAIRTILA